MAAGTKVDKVWFSKGHSPAALVHLTKLNDLIGVGIGKGTQQDAVNHTENGGRGADAECECKNRDRSEARPLCKTANAEAKIFDKCLHSNDPFTKTFDRIKGFSERWVPRAPTFRLLFRLHRMPHHELTLPLSAEQSGFYAGSDYEVFKSPLEDFRKAVEEARLADRVRYLSHGETYEFEVNRFRTAAGP